MNKNSIPTFTLIEPTGYRKKKAGIPVPPSYFPHIGLAHLAAVLKLLGNVRVIDVAQTPVSKIGTLLNDPSDFTLFTSTSFNYLDAREIAVDYSLADKSRLIIGGPHVSIVKKEVFADGPWHLAVAGEGELLLEDIITNYPSFEKPIPGLLFPDKDIYSPSQRIDSLDSLPRPDYSAFPMGQYSNHVLLTSRGCPFSCSFCAAPVINGPKWFYRSIPDVIDEMNEIVHTYGDKVIHLNDDNFTLRRERVIEFCENIINGKKRFRWVAQGVRADKIDMMQLRLMHRAGCERISIGVESADPEVLAAIGKRESVEQIRKAIWMARDAGIEVLSMFVIGTRNDTLDKTRVSFDFVKRNALYPVDFYQIIPYPGTKEWDSARKKGRFLVDDYRQFDHYSEDPVFETDTFTAQQRKSATVEAASIRKQMERKWFWIKHLRFFLPHLLIHRTITEIKEELRFLLFRVFSAIKKRGFVREF